VAKNGLRGGKRLEKETGLSQQYTEGFNEGNIVRGSQVSEATSAARGGERKEHAKRAYGVSEREKTEPSHESAFMVDSRGKREKKRCELRECARKSGQSSSSSPDGAVMREVVTPHCHPGLRETGDGRRHFPYMSGRRGTGMSLKRPKT